MLGTAAGMCWVQVMQKSAELIVWFLDISSIDPIDPIDPRCIFVFVEPSKAGRSQCNTEFNTISTCCFFLQASDGISCPPWCVSVYLDVWNLWQTQTTSALYSFADWFHFWIKLAWGQSGWADQLRASYVRSCSKGFSMTHWGNYVTLLHVGISHVLNTTYTW